VFLTLLKAIYQATKRLARPTGSPSLKRRCSVWLRSTGFPSRAIGPECDYGGRCLAYLMNLAEFDSLSCPAAFRTRRLRCRPGLVTGRVSNAHNPPSRRRRAERFPSDLVMSVVVAHVRRRALVATWRCVTLNQSLGKVGASPTPRGGVDVRFERGHVSRLEADNEVVEFRNAARDRITCRNSASHQ